MVHRNDQMKGNYPMRAFESMSGRVVAALSSLAFSAFFFAAAIVPASPSLFGAGVVA